MLSLPRKMYAIVLAGRSWSMWIPPCSQNNRELFTLEGVLRKFMEAFPSGLALQSLYNWSESCVCIFGNGSSVLFSGLHQRCGMLWILFVVFIKIIYRRSRGVEIVRSGDFSTRSLPLCWWCISVFFFEPRTSAHSEVQNVKTYEAAYYQVSV